MYKKICKCRICGNTDLKKIVDLGNQKLTGVFPLKGQMVLEAPLTLVKCMGENKCGLVQLQHSCDCSEMYGQNYGYRSGLNAGMVKHLGEIVEALQKKVDLKSSDIILDIGSNDGTTLGLYEKNGYDLVGMDPTGIKFKEFYSSDISLIPDFFSGENFKKVRAEKKAKIITSISMFYDLEEPQKFVDDIDDILSDEGIWFMEQSYLPTMIDMNSYDTICQEHLEYYCLYQINWLLKDKNLHIIDVEKNDTNGGSFQVYIARKNSKYEVSSRVFEMQKYELEKQYNTINPYKRFWDDIEKSKKNLLDFLIKKKMEGACVLGYGASTKGNVLLQYCGITSEYISAIAEVNPDKYGHYTPGTNIPIISEAEARKMKPDYFLVLPWHFKNFILKKESEYMKNSGCKFVFPLPNLEVVCE